MIYYLVGQLHAGETGLSRLLKQHFPSDEIKNISSTKIRKQMKKDGKL